MNTPIINTLVDLFEASTGELETKFFVHTIMEFTGGGPREMAIKFFCDKFTDPPPNDVYIELNGTEFLVTNGTNTLHESFVRVTVESTSIKFPYGGWTYIDDDDFGVLDLTAQLRLAWELMEDNLVCHCRQSMALGSDFGLCRRCKGSYSTTTCPTCHSHWKCRCSSSLF